MDAITLARLVLTMRQAQADYFRLRREGNPDAGDALRASKAAEAAVDRAVVGIIDGQTSFLAAAPEPVVDATLIQRATAVMLAMSNHIEDVPYIDHVVTDDEDDERGAIHINIADDCPFVTVRNNEGQPMEEVAEAICATGSVIRELLAAIGKEK